MCFFTFIIFFFYSDFIWIYNIDIRRLAVCNVLGYGRHHSGFSYCILLPRTILDKLWTKHSDGQRTNVIRRAKRLRVNRLRLFIRKQTLFSICLLVYRFLRVFLVHTLICLENARAYHGKNYARRLEKYMSVRFLVRIRKKSTEI